MLCRVNSVYYKQNAIVLTFGCCLPYFQLLLPVTSVKRWADGESVPSRGRQPRHAVKDSAACPVDKRSNLGNPTNFVFLSVSEPAQQLRACSYGDLSGAAGFVSAVWAGKGFPLLHSPSVSLVSAQTHASRAAADVPPLSCAYTAALCSAGFARGCQRRAVARFRGTGGGRAAAPPARPACGCGRVRAPAGLIEFRAMPPRDCAPHAPVRL